MLGVKGNTMKKAIALIFTASILILAGCCTTPHATRWEYKVTVAPPLPGTESPSSTNMTSFSAWSEHRNEISRKWRDNVQGYLDELGKDGWVLITERDGTLYLKRPIK